MTSSKQSLLKNATWFSKILFLWLSPLFSKEVKDSDSYELPEKDCAEKLIKKLESEWNKELAKASPSLVLATCRAFWCRYFFLGWYIFIFETSKIVQPILIASFVDCFLRLKSHDSIQDAYLYATAIVVLLFIGAVVRHTFYFGVARTSMWLRVACTGLVYRKILRLNQKALHITSTGQIVNLLTNDVQKFDNFVSFAHYIWILPVQAVVVFVLLWQRIGLATVAGFLILVLLISFQFWMGRLFRRLREHTGALTDERVKLVSEIINGIRVIKLYCWEDFFRRQIEIVRSLEQSMLQRTFLSSLIAQSPYYWHNKFMILVMLVFVYLQDKVQFMRVMNLSTIFLTIGLIKNIRDAIGISIPYLVLGGAEINISFQRLQTFLLLPEIRANRNCIEDTPNEACALLHDTPKYDIKIKEKFDNMKNGVCEKPRLIVQDLSVSWHLLESNKSSAECTSTFTLKNVTFSVANSELVVIVGPVGAGKSSLLMTFLNELQPSSGRVIVHGKLGYVSQQPWVFGDTLRNNILCGQPFEEARYQRALDCAALLPDLVKLRSGDQTMVGERGVVLSGGQRARVSLARAVYQNADIYLLDDPLSAVDAKIRQALFERCILGELAHKPRILVTHNMHFARQADQILVFQDGCITAQGTFEHLQNIGVEFMDLVCDKEKLLVDPLNTPISTEKYFGQSMTSSCDLILDYENSFPLIKSVDRELNFNYEEEELTVEHQISGKVTWKTYIYYFRAFAQPVFHLLLILLISAVQVILFFSDWWLTKWVTDISNETLSNDTSALTVSLNYSQDIVFGDRLENITSIMHQLTACEYFLVYSAFVLGLLVVPIIFNIIFILMTTRASRLLHKRIFSTLLGTPMLFFDSNPAGRILNRFSKDIGIIDYEMPENLIEYLTCLSITFFGVLVAVVINFYTILPTLPLLGAFLYLRTYYLKTSREVARIENTTRSPIFTHINTSLLGLTTVRAMRHESKFIDVFSDLCNRHSSAYLMSCGCSGWFALRLELLCILFVAFAIYVSVFMASQVDGALVGLSLTYLLDLVLVFQWAVQKSTEFEIQMISVERILEYTQLDQEEICSSAATLPDDWPYAGSLQFQNVSFRYSIDQPLVLLKIDFKINSMEKIGIVGRTGSGKSSLLAALFRLAEIENDGGSIFIDNVSTRTMPLKVLRSKLSVIPQDPVLFCGTIRHNLDPFGRHNDARIWQTLKEVQLEKVVADLNGGLEYNIVAGGHNFSVGERQLLCLARALFCRNRLLIIDEATANVDPQTDALIQKTLRTHFAQCTVLTIAHRLQTVVDSDKLLVLDGGRVVQFDHPHRLLELKSGHLYDLIQSLDSKEKKALKSTARLSFEKRRY